LAEESRVTSFEVMVVSKLNESNPDKGKAARDEVDEWERV
jgi:hypothetical protein